MTTNITPNMTTLIANLRWAADKCGTFTFEDNDSQGRMAGKGQTLSQIQRVWLYGQEYLACADHWTSELAPLFGTPEAIAELLIRRQLDDDETEE